MTRPTLRNGHLIGVAAIALVVRDIPVHTVSLPDNHVAMDERRVREYADMLRRGYTPPPPLVQVDQATGRTWLIEGRHRFVAHLIVGRDTITAVCTATVDLVEPGAAP